MSTEIWREIVNPVDVGFISNLGNVKNKKGILRKLHKSNKGYMRVGFKGGLLTCSVHRLVAEAFLPKTNDKNCVNHKDLNKTNNCLENLEWVTHSENTFHHFKNNARGFDMRNRKLTNQQYVEAFAKRKAGSPYAKLTSEYGVSQASLCKKFQRMEKLLCL